ncbi:MAG: hypothetical protein KatS3mg008_1353 [Acidimicrobiales bacterium]|nr:MAG: hypothetical protein KatS3mg008_1353 [Acidimicrobiales bacterium]
MATIDRALSELRSLSKSSEEESAFRERLSELEGALEAARRRAAADIVRLADIARLVDDTVLETVTEDLKRTRRALENSSLDGVARSAAEQKLELLVRRHRRVHEVANLLEESVERICATAVEAEAAVHSAALVTLRSEMESADDLAGHIRDLDASLSAIESALAELDRQVTAPRDADPDRPAEWTRPEDGPSLGRS